MTLRFYSDESQEYAGFEFTVTLEKIPVVNGAITIAGNTATIDGNYAGNDEFRITESIEVDEVRLNRTFPVLDGNLYSTLVLPFSISLDKVTGLEALYGFNYMEEGETTSNHQASLLERYQVMQRHYGPIQTILLHGWFVVRGVVSKIKAML